MTSCQAVGRGSGCYVDPVTRPLLSPTCMRPLNTQDVAWIARLACWHLATNKLPLCFVTHSNLNYVLLRVHLIIDSDSRCP